MTNWWDKYDLITALDFETFFSDELTLGSGKGNHDYFDYVNSPLYETLALGITFDGKTAYAYAPKDIPTILWAIGLRPKGYVYPEGEQRKKILCIGQNMRFDATILVQHYKFDNVDCFDIMLAARALGVSHLVGANLEVQSKMVLGRQKNLGPTWEHLCLNPNSDAAHRILLGTYYRALQEDKKLKDRAERYGRQHPGTPNLDAFPKEMLQYLQQRHGHTLWQAAADTARFTSVVEAMRGKRLSDMNQDELSLYYRYVKEDALSTYQIAMAYMPKINAREAELIRISIRMYTHPTLTLDADILQKAIVRHKENKTAKLDAMSSRLNLEGDLKKLLGSADKFVGLIYPMLGLNIPPYVAPKYPKNPHKKGTQEQVIYAEQVKADKKVHKQKWMEDLKALAEAHDLPSPVDLNAKGDFGFKTSKTSDLITYMLEEFSEDGLFAEIAQLKLECSSNIELTRMERFYKKAIGSPLFPIPLEYAKAHTGRYGGADKLNLQNLPSRFGSPILRKALRAIKGHKLISVDSSQIEARINAYFCQEPDLLGIFARKEDPYVYMAAIIYGEEYDTLLAAYKSGCPIAKKKRGVGKEAVLACGYGMGHVKFASRLLDQGIVLDPDLATHNMMAKEIVEKYRKTNSRISGMWKRCDTALRNLINGKETWLGGPDGMIVHFCYKEIFGEWVAAIELPGYDLFYPRLRSSTVDGKPQMEYWRRKGPVSGDWIKLYGGKIVENIVQSMAFCAIKDQAVVLNQVAPLAINVHDEFVAVVPNADCKRVADLFVKIMSAAPSWAPGIPLAAEAMVHNNFYGGSMTVDDLIKELEIIKASLGGHVELLVKHESGANVGVWRVDPLNKHQVELRVEDL